MMIKSVKLGPLETKLLFTLEEKRIRAFNFNQAKEILATSESSVQNVLFRLKRKNRITEIEKGKYILNPAKSGLEGYWTEDSYTVVDHLLREYYIGMWSALSYWGMTEQLPQVLYVVTPRRKKDLWYSGQQIKFVRIVKKRFFGFIIKEMDVGTFKVASQEKAILDALTYPQHTGGMVEATKALWNARNDINWNLLLQYLNELGIDAVKRRLGYLLQVLKIEEGIQQKLRDDFKGFRWLDPSSKKVIKAYSKPWGLKVNLDKAKLLSWRGS